MKKLKDLQKEFKNEEINLMPINGTEVSEEEREKLLERGVVGNKAVAKGFYFVTKGQYFHTPGNEGRVSTQLRFGLIELDSEGEKVDTSTISKRQLTSSRESIINAGLLGKTDADLIDALEGHVIEVISREFKLNAAGEKELDRYDSPIEIITWAIAE